MANRIKGIIVEIGGDTIGLQKALKDVNDKSKNVYSELKEVEKALKLDPTNTELLAQKQQLLSKQAEIAKEKLSALKDVQKQVEQQFKSGQIGEEQYRAFQREVAVAEGNLKNLEEQLDDTVQGSYAYMTEQEIGLKVSKSNIVSDLDDQMSGITITSSSIAIGTTGTFSVDSSNFRLATNGNLTVRKITFDHTGQGFTDMVIDNGKLTSGNMTLDSSGLMVEGASNAFTFVPGGNVQINSGTGGGSVTLSANSSNKLTVNGDAVLTAGDANITVSSSVTIGNLFGACTYIDTGSILVGGYQANATVITSGGGVSTPALVVNNHSLSFYEVIDTNGNSRQVLGY